MDIQEDIRIAKRQAKERRVERLIGFALFNLAKGKLQATETLLRKAYKEQTGTDWDA